MQQNGKIDSVTISGTRQFFSHDNISPDNFSSPLPRQCPEEIHKLLRVNSLRSRRIAPGQLGSTRSQFSRGINKWWFQDDSKMIPRWFQDDSKMIPRWFQDDSKTIPRWFQDDSKMIPRWFQDDSNMIPIWFQDDSERFQEIPKDSRRIQEIPRDSKRFQEISEDS